MTHLGGRPRQIEVADIVRAGRELGLRKLSLHAVASRLQVSATALYRHVDGRWGLERLIGEDILAELELRDDPARDAAGHLLASSLQLRCFVLQHPGLAGYLQTLFPRGSGGRRLLAAQVDALENRGYAPDAAVVLATGVAWVAIGYAAAEDAQQDRSEGLSDQRRIVMEGLLEDVRLGPAHRGLPVLDADEYVRLWLGTAIRAFVDAAPPGRPVAAIRTALDAAGRGE